MERAAAPHPNPLPIKDGEREYRAASLIARPPRMRGAARLLPLPASGERVGVRGRCESNANCDKRAWRPAPRSGVAKRQYRAGRLRVAESPSARLEPIVLPLDGLGDDAALLPAARPRTAAAALAPHPHQPRGDRVAHPHELARPLLRRSSCICRRRIRPAAIGFRLQRVARLPLPARGERVGVRGSCSRCAGTIWR